MPSRITRIEVYSRRAISGRRGKRNEALVSVETPRSDYAARPGADFEGWALRPLVLIFDDIEKQAGTAPDDWLSAGSLMSREQADRVLMYAYEAADAGANTLIVHCDAGVSRSTALGSVLAEIHGASLHIAHPEPRPNQYVLDLLRLCALRHGVKSRPGARRAVDNLRGDDGGWLRDV